MKQYIIIEKSEYHGDNIHGTYKTRKEAEQYIKKEKKNDYDA